MTTHMAEGPSEWFLDVSGRIIRRTEYGIRSQFGWFWDPHLGPIHWTVFDHCA